MRRKAAGLVAAALALVPATTGCTSQVERFCDAQREQADLAELVAALGDGDGEAIDAALLELRELEELAPDEVADDVGAVLAAAEGAVRYVRDVGEGGEPGAVVSLEEVNRALGDAVTPAQRLEAWVADRCGG